MNVAAAGNRAFQLPFDAERGADLPNPETARIAIVGLGDAGADLANAFARTGPVVAIDSDPTSIEALIRSQPKSGDGPAGSIAGLEFTSDAGRVGEAEVVIVCVPVAVRRDRRPGYEALLSATRSVATHMKRGAVIVFGRTVEPGATENRCIPVLEQFSGLRLSADFHVGYSPEGTRPSEPARRADDAHRIVAGSSPAVTEFLARLYGRIGAGGLVRAATIRAAEAAKVLEHAQRDVNIALVNEAMQVFDAMGIRISDVLAAAATKVDFQSYFPGLVGGRSLTVDPLYVLNAGRENGHAMEVVAAARQVNERTAEFVADKVHGMLAPRAPDLQGFRVLVLGRSFKDNCPRTRDSRSFAVIDSLWSRGADVYSYDPVARDDRFEGGRGAVIIDRVEDFAPYDAVVVTTAHDVFRKEIDVFRLAAIAPRRAPVVDLRKLFDPELARLHFQYWTV